jgi:nitrate reductase gamma subunit
VRDDRAIPHWAKIAIIVLEVLSFVAFAIVLIFTDDIASFLTDRVGTAAVIIGGVVGTAILIGIAYLLFDRPSRRRS